MKKVMVFNFKTMQFEQASTEEGNEFISLIDAMNSDCAAQHRVHRAVCTDCQTEVSESDVYCPKCGLWNPANRR